MRLIERSENNLERSKDSWYPGQDTNPETTD